MDWLGPLVPIIASIIVSVLAAIITLLVGNRRGLPDIDAEIDRRKQELVETLEAQLNTQARDFKACKVRLEATEAENRQLWRRVRATEVELLDLYRRVGVKPPQRLSHPDNDGGLKDD